MERSLSILAAILLLRFVSNEASYQRARRNGHELRFPVGVLLRIVFGIGIPMFLYAAYQTVLQARSTGEWWLPSIALTLVLLAILGDPGEIVVTSDGIECRRLLGLRRARVQWEKAGASHVPGLREVLVVGSDGTQITHTRYHVGQEEFLFELERHRVTVC